MWVKHKFALLFFAVSVLIQYSAGLVSIETIQTKRHSNIVVFQDTFWVEDTFALNKAYSSKNSDSIFRINLISDTSRGIGVFGNFTMIIDLLT
tara:strand:+ start:1172 stop:1450 length:279 start_codon:yes stop_codon:yes gene_type:complete